MPCALTLGPVFYFFLWYLKGMVWMSYVHALSALECLAVPPTLSPPNLFLFTQRLVAATEE